MGAVFESKPSGIGQGKQCNLQGKFAADLLQVQKAVTSDAIVDCSERQIGGSRVARDRMDPPGTI